MTRLTLIFAVLIASLGLSACNTIEGAGQDIKSTGKAVERSAASAKYAARPIRRR